MSQKGTQTHGLGEHLPRDGEDAIDDRILGVLCWLNVNISYKWRVETVLEVEHVSRTLFCINIDSAFSQSVPSSVDRPSGYVTLEAKPTSGRKHLEPSLGFG